MSDTASESQKQPEKETLAADKKLKCQTCDAKDFEENFHICETCNQQNLKQFESEEEVLKIAICSTCAIKKHIRQGHDTIDFFPLFLDCKMRNKMKTVQATLENFEKIKNLRKGEEQTWKTMNETAEARFNQLIELTRKSNSTTNLQQNMDEINSFIETTTNQTERYVEIMKAQTMLIQGNIQKMDNWIAEKKKECVNIDDTADQVDLLSIQNFEAIGKANEYLSNRSNTDNLLTPD